MGFFSDESARLHYYFLKMPDIKFKAICKEKIQIDLKNEPQA
ncbi:hypothetical protein CKA32_000785 [Geitlerinema sp. FC II]|nr:hypothetical protein CKA32_000785 [Geitlerinema sp. FC II]